MHQSAIVRYVTIMLVVLAAAAVPRMAGAQTTWERVQREGVVRVGFTNEAPYGYALADGTLTGVEPELLRDFLAGTNIKMEPILVQFDGLVPGLQARRFDVIVGGLAITPARCNQVAFSNPGWVSTQGFLVKKGNPKNLRSYLDVTKDSSAILGVMQGSVHIGFAQVAGIPEDRVLLFKDYATAGAALQTGRIHAIGMPTVSLRDLLARRGQPDIEEAILSEQPLRKDGRRAQNHGGLAFRQQDGDFVAAYNTHLAAMRQAGRLEKIVAKFNFTLPSTGVTAADLCAGKS